jgi:hypothetical protein
MKKWLYSVAFMFFALCVPCGAHAEWGLVNAMDLSPFIPIVLDALVSVAMTGYEFFVGKGDGIIYLLVWGWLGFTMGMYLVKMYIPESWLAFFGLKGGQMWSGTTATKISEDLIKPCLRAIIAAGLLLQVKPQYVTEFIVDPFLRFGAIYTESISDNIAQNSMFGVAKQQPCPASIIEKKYISAESCKFLVQPVADITHANNQIVKRGLTFISSGLKGLMTLIPHGGQDLLSLITGLLLVFAFVSSNFFMALLIIQAIFDFGMALILYPFSVLVFVAKQSDKWIDPWPAFEGIIKSLKKLVITMIACVFILAVNIAAIKALFNWNNSVFVVTAGGSASSSVPVIANDAIGFGGHSVVWLSAILTFFLMFEIFKKTKEQLVKYTGDDKITKLHDQVIGDAKSSWKSTTGTVKKITGVFKKK